jgi:23S rRNA pseudouridine2605 synthase
MAKEFKRSGGKDFKGKKSFGPKKDKGEKSDKKPFFDKKDGDSKPRASFKRNDSDSYEKKASDSPKSRTDKRDSKPAFERYRDDSRPSDFGSSKKQRSNAPSNDFNKKENSEKTPFIKKASEDLDKKPAFGGRNEDKRKKYGKKPFSEKASKGKPKSSANPYDLDESDFEHGTKPSYTSEKGKDFKKKPYEKKPYEKKNWSSKKPSASKPQREVDDGMSRLNKFIANAGICSRREADDLIASGVVQVNGKTVTEMGYRVKPTDIIKYGGQTLKRERMVYLILNKPKDYITTADDPQQRRTVLELVQGACKERIYPVGRLDRATTGLLMFTNDGDLTKKLTHPKYGVRKIYHVELDKPLKRADLDQIAAGLELEDGPIKVDEVTYVGDGTDKAQVGVEIHSGKNRIVRRIFEHMGYNVRKLDRVMFGSLTKKDLSRGRWRLLSEAEVGMLKMISVES